MGSHQKDDCVYSSRDTESWIGRETEKPGRDFSGLAGLRCDTITMRECALLTTCMTLLSGIERLVTDHCTTSPLMGVAADRGLLPAAL